MRYCLRDGGVETLEEERCLISGCEMYKWDAHTFHLIRKRMEGDSSALLVYLSKREAEE
jgi:hypothetical protein